ncbi:hypothetical protein C8Q76DRAFT_688181 [Earliella scabrosa]|nr:hypothetical protein C8Q76DRAFT_688181 [Earliella scabrosa]
MDDSPFQTAWLQEAPTDDIGFGDRNGDTVLVPRSLVLSIRRVQRMQTELNNRTTDLENELYALRAKFASSVQTSKSLLLKTQETITKERRNMARAQEGAVDTMQSLNQKLGKAHLAIATLQAQHLADKETMERMATDIAEVIAIQEEMGSRLQWLDECEQSLRVTAEQTKGLVRGLGEDAPVAPPDVPGLATSSRTLAEELGDARPHSTTPHPYSLPLSQGSHASTGMFNAALYSPELRSGSIEATPDVVKARSIDVPMLREIQARAHLWRAKFADCLTSGQQMLSTWATDAQCRLDGVAAEASILVSFTFTCAIDRILRLCLVGLPLTAPKPLSALESVAFSHFSQPSPLTRPHCRRPTPYRSPPVIDTHLCLKTSKYTDEFGQERPGAVLPNGEYKRHKIAETKRSAQASARESAAASTRGSTASTSREPNAPTPEDPDVDRVGAQVLLATLQPHSSTSAPVRRRDMENSTNEHARPTSAATKVSEVRILA